MIKRKPLSACNGRFRSRKSSAVRTLVAETLVLAKTHGYVEKIEDELEAELARDISDPPKEKLKRWRRGGDKIFKSKHVLLTVVILCIVDCALVLGELALDLYKVKATLEQTDSMTKNTEAFLDNLKRIYPHTEDKRQYEVFSLLLNSDIMWADQSFDENVAADTEDVPCNYTAGYQTSDELTEPSDKHSSGIVPRNASNIFYKEPEAHEFYDLDIVGGIAHIFHYCSIAILLIILAETILKAICAGKDFFHRKLEVFDAFVVLISFVLDFSFLVFLPDIDTKDFVFILAILLPWRVIRVVNSLVVSVKDHEHFRLKLVYKRKKRIQGNLRDTEAILQKYICQVTNLHRLCIMEGVDEWKVDNCLRNEESLPTTPSKKKFKFKLDESLFSGSGQSRSPRGSLPTLELHGLKLPSNGTVSKSRISLPAVANTIKDHIKRTSRRASLAAVEMCNLKSSLQELRKRKSTADNLCTMHEEEFNEPKGRKRDSLSSSRASFLTETGDDISETVSTSQYSMRTCPRGKSLSRASTCSIESDDIGKITDLQQSAKRRLSESNVDRRGPSYGMTDIVCFRDSSGKTYTKPYFRCDRYSAMEKGAHFSDGENRMSSRFDCSNDDIANPYNEIGNACTDDELDDVIIIEVPSPDSITENTMEIRNTEPTHQMPSQEQHEDQSQAILENSKHILEIPKFSIERDTMLGDNELKSADLKVVTDNEKDKSHKVKAEVSQIVKEKDECIEEQTQQYQSIAMLQEPDEGLTTNHMHTECQIKATEDIKPSPNEVRSRIANGVCEKTKTSISNGKANDVAHGLDKTNVANPKKVVVSNKDNFILEYEIKDKDNCR